jgi:hypothetical protein
VFAWNDHEPGWVLQHVRSTHDSLDDAAVGLTPYLSLYQHTEVFDSRREYSVMDGVSMSSIYRLLTGRPTSRYWCFVNGILIGSGSVTLERFFNHRIDLVEWIAAEHQWVQDMGARRRQLLRNGDEMLEEDDEDQDIKISILDTHNWTVEYISISAPAAAEAVETADFMENDNHYTMVNEEAVGLYIDGPQEEIGVV